MNPVKELIDNIEESKTKYGYEIITITLTNGDKITTDIDEITYATRYFLKIKKRNTENIININNLARVDLT